MISQQRLATACLAIPDDLIRPVARALQRLAKDHLGIDPPSSLEAQAFACIGRAADDVLTSPFVRQAHEAAASHGPAQKEPK